MLSEKEIKKFIDDDIKSAKKKQAAEGQRYYDAEHDILKYKLFYYNADGELVEDKTRSNAKISHPFFTELTDQISAYVTSFDENPIRAKEGDNAQALQKHLDHYFDDDFWAEVEDWVADGYIKGAGELYMFRDEDRKLVFECADAMGVVKVKAKFASDKKDHVLYWYIDEVDKDGNKVIKIIDWTAHDKTFYVQKKKDSGIELDETVEQNPCPHTIYRNDDTGEKLGKSFGHIPFFSFTNNKKELSGLKPIKDLIDDYDLMQCGLTNNLVDFDTPLYAVKGFDGEDFSKMFQNVKTKKMIGVGEGGDVEVKTIDIPYQARQAKAADDEKNIYRFGMGLNTQGLKDTSATTNIAIKAAYSLLDLKANKLTKRLKKALKPIIKIVLDEINAEYETDFQMKDIEFNFTRTVMTNEQENVQNDLTRANTRQVEINTILNVAAQVGDEQTLKAICEEMDWDFEKLKGEVQKLQEAQSVIDAKNALEGAVIDDEETVLKGIE